MKKLPIQPYAIEPKRSIDLTLSENPLGSSPEVLNLLHGRDAKRCVSTPSLYPSANANKLRNKLAEFLECAPDNIFVSSGSEGIILNIPRVLAKPNDTAMIPQLSFPLFGMYCQFAGLNIQLIPMDAELGIDLLNFEEAIEKRSLPTLIFLCNPNNPTGMVLSRSQMIKFLSEVPESVTVIIDEANIDFGGISVIDQALSRPNVLVLRTFSKGFGLAGFRIGFAVGDPKLIKLLTTQTQPFPISSFSEQLAITSLLDLKFVEQSKQYMDIEREKLKRALTKLGCTVFNSQANNIFVKLPSHCNTKIFFEKLTQNDTSVIKGSKFFGFDDSFFRISPRNRKTNDKFLEIMKKIL